MKELKSKQNIPKDKKHEEFDQEIQNIFQEDNIEKNTSCNTNSQSEQNQRLGDFMEDLSDTLENKERVKEKENKPASTNLSRIEGFYQNQQLTKALQNLLQQIGFQNKTKVFIKLTGQKAEQFQLNKEDIKKLFSKFGQIKSIEMNNNYHSAIIMYNDELSSLFSIKYLNGFKIKEEQVELKNYNQSMNPYLYPIQFQMNNFNMPQFFNGNMNRNDFGNITCQSNQMKFTSRYEIQIKNDKKFNVSQRIIGTRVILGDLLLFFQGINMKKIIEVCEQRFAYLNVRGGNLVKLRLRGQGSGFKEGPDKRESYEPLHLCVSSKFQEVYNLACQCIEELVNQIYTQYFDFCEKNKLAYNATITIKKLNGHGKYPKDKKKSKKKLHRKGTWSGGFKNNNFRVNNNLNYNQQLSFQRLNSYPQATESMNMLDNWNQFPIQNQFNNEINFDQNYYGNNNVQKFNQSNCFYPQNQTIFPYQQKQQQQGYLNNFLAYSNC